MNRLRMTLLLFFIAGVSVPVCDAQPLPVELNPPRIFPERRLSDEPPLLPSARRDVWVSQYEPTSREKKLLTPENDDLQAFANLLSQPDTGLIRIYPAARSRAISVDQLESGQRPGFRSFASTYSFSKKKHGHGLQGYVDPRLGWAEIRLTESGMLITGITGSSIGVLVSLGDVALESVTANTRGVLEIADFKPPLNSDQERHLTSLSRAGFKLNGFGYRAYLPAAVDTTYALRSISNKRADVLVAFRIVREHDDGSLTLLWKKLKSHPKPSWKKNK